MLLLDTNVLIRIDEVRPPTEDVVLSALTYAELRFGIERARDPRMRRRRSMELARLNAIFPTPWLSFDQPAADSYARLAARVSTQRASHARSTDIMLAGHANSLGAKLMTFNVKDFDLVADEVEIVVPELR
ncbi:type II toxin-antitoxin system VapC family toxin [Microbacterium sp. SA39]|uniref:type II toxin-antitoxin system VapC family toxin n=1 Tax=Microbacterium sp. SA39 TaxID=1263625 RepID=UPI0005F9DF5E|nr:PIN domain-containing protein [Microbacterium sp. SA39]KJQ52589.1 Ribonuclease VapC1 [Microbacterium sp. SA39]